MVTPQEAQAALDSSLEYPISWTKLARTVATEPKRTRAAVVKELRVAANMARGDRTDSVHIRVLADEIENGADW